MSTRRATETTETTETEVLEQLATETEGAEAKAQEQGGDNQIENVSNKPIVITKADKIKAAINKAEELVEFTAPLTSDPEDKQISLTINGYTYVIQRGTTVSVPRKVVDLYNNSQKQKYRTNVIKSRITQIN